MSAARLMTPAQRRAYIDVSRRSQPMDELRRKAAKAKRRWLSTMEHADLDLAEWHVVNLALWKRDFTWWPINYCSQCGQFGGGRWNEATKRFALPIQHKPRCAYAADDGPYPGWSAVSSRVPGVVAA